MRSLSLVALTMVTALGATQADAQRLGRGSPATAGASYPMPNAGGQTMPAPQTPRPQISPQMQRPPVAQLGRPNPGPRPQGNWSNQGERPPQGNWSNQGQRPPQGNWSNQSQRPPQGNWSNQGQRPPQGNWSNQGQRPPQHNWSNQGQHPQQGNWNHQRWGGTVGGRWQGGSNAPGGWNAYHRPSRGYHVPRYWYSPSFFIGDYTGYGLFAPPAGYGWYRYYDDAVLLDSRGQVYDSVNGVDWDGGYDDGSYGADGYGDQPDGYGQDGGYAQGSGYSQSYQQQGYAPLPPVAQNGTVATYSTSSGYASGGGGYVSGGYYFPGATTTVVTINPAPAVTTTTTTTEYVEETRTRYVAPRRVYHAPKKRYYRPVRRKCGCVVE